MGSEVGERNNTLDVLRSKRAIVYTLGCRLNHAESALIADRLQAAGYTLAENGQPADLCIINTCTVTAEADAKSRKMIRALIRRNPTAYVAVVGCYAQLAQETLSGIEGVDLIVGTQDKLRVLDYVSERKNLKPRVVCTRIEDGDFQIEPCDPVARPSAHRANLKIQDGCNLRCSYCIVPMARGPARSRQLENLLAEARSLAERGVKEIVLTGVNVGAYDYKGYALLDVVDQINGIEGIERIRISSIEWSTISEGLFDRMNDPSHALAPFLHIPLQSGSDRILGLMRRNYTARDFLAFLQKADAAARDLCVGADILVGFPGETEADFEATCQLLLESSIAYAHVFKYSDRRGVEAEQMTEKVDAGTLNRRSAQARRIGEDKRRQYHERHLGNVLEVLFEAQVSGRWHGYTGNYIRVAVCSSECLENALHPVRLETDCGEVVLGRLEG